MLKAAYEKAVEDNKEKVQRLQAENEEIKQRNAAAKLDYVKQNTKYEAEIHKYKKELVIEYPFRRRQVKMSRPKIKAALVELERIKIKMDTSV